jgi:hypothetical protein
MPVRAGENKQAAEITEITASENVRASARYGPLESGITHFRKKSEGAFGFSFSWSYEVGRTIKRPGPDGVIHAPSSGRSHNLVTLSFLVRSRRI